MDETKCPNCGEEMQMHQKSSEFTPLYICPNCHKNYIVPGYLSVDVTEAKKKLQEVTDMLEHIYKLIDKSWLLRLIFFGIKKAQ